MTAIRVEDGHLVLETSFRDRDLVRQLPGARFDQAQQYWTAPLSWAVLWAVRGIFGADADVDQAVRDWAAQEYHTRIQPAMALRDHLNMADWDGEDWWNNMWGFQRVGAQFLWTAGQALLADEMGTGKTIQAIGALRTMHLFGDEPLPALIICPNSMKRVWGQELAKWWPEVTVQLVDGGAVGRRKQLALEADIYVMNWEALRLHTRLAPYGSVNLRGCEVCTRGNEDPQSRCQRCPRELNDMPLRTIIADEAHRAKDPKSQQTRALWSVGTQAIYRFALTGTPIANHPGDLWPLLRFLSPEEWPSKVRFVDRYCQQTWNRFGGMEITGLRMDTAEEFRQAFNPRFLRRPKAVVLPDLPPKVYSKRYVKMSPKQRKAYTTMAREMLAELGDDLVVVTNALAKATRLSQFAAAYAEIDEDGKLRLTLPSCKVAALLDIMEEAGDEQVVVFSESRQLLALMEQAFEKAGYRYGVIAGGVDNDTRQEALEAFGAKDLQAMLLTFGAGGEGLTLLAPNLVFLQRPWSMVQSRQAEDRVHRPGQEAEKVNIIDIVTIDTLEERRFEVLGDKEIRLEEIVRDKETFQRLVLG